MSVPGRVTQFKRDTARYLLRLFLNGSLYQGSVPGVRSFNGGEFQLPLAPQQVKLESKARSQFIPHGLGQVADEHGVTPPDISIAGTFGQGVWNGMDGREWQRELERFIRYYLEENYRRGTRREPLFSLSWHDTYRGENWYVVPEVIPYGEQDASNPYRERYSLRLKGLRPYEDWPAPYDPLAQTLQPSTHDRVLTTRHGARVEVSEPRESELPEGGTITTREVQVSQSTSFFVVPTGDPKLDQQKRALIITALDGNNYKAAERYAGVKTWEELDEALEAEQ
jgi:hypothetical protein